MGIRELKVEVYRICATLARAPRSKRLSLLRREIEQLPEDCREIALSLVSTALATTEGTASMQTWEKITMMAAGIIFVGVLLALAWFVPEPTAFQFFVFRVVLALAGSAFVSALPGLLQVEGRIKSWVVRAGGSLGVFVLIYSLNPPRLLTAAISSGL
ncbi:MAG: hypothetical protein U1G07_08300 [Verrucomicrobiota bacterium]